MSGNKIKFGVIGCGHIGKRHAEMITRNADCELVALCDVLPKEKLGLGAYPNVPFFPSVEAMLSSGIDMDVVSVCSPNGLHATHALNVLEAKKHVVCEKPMALKKSNCEEVIHKSMQVHRQVFCVMQNRYSPPAEWLKELIESKKLGDIYMVQLNCYWNRDDRYYKAGTWKGKKDMDGGVLFTQFSHFIDMMYWLFGDIDKVKAHFFNFNHQKTTEFDDSGVVSFHFTKQGMGCINFSTSVWDTNFESSLTIIGEKGTVKVGGQYMDKIEYCHIKDYTMPTLAPTNPANDYGSYKGPAANHHYIIENVVKTLKGDSSVTTNALEGMKVVDMIERIYAAKKK
ncbi:MAG TPA: Gfo/Idh/MocA family oxidoreductase [Bacteroidia bacterium]|nr:Gfo/Idh/MocA family oxidoreductase [Bacteroidia bacterium]